MTQKTRYALISLLTTLGIIGLIFVLWNTWTTKAFHTSHIPIYPNSNNAIRSLRHELPSNVFIRTGILFDQTTTFQTSDTMNEIVAYYHTTYPHVYPCDIQAADTTVTKSSFRCIESSGNSIVTYSVEIIINSTSSSVQTVLVSEVQNIRSKEDW
jgi:hypothetical protein